MKELMKVAESSIDKFEGNFVKLVFRDGNTVVAKRGELVSSGEDFVELKTKENDILVNVSDIVKIQRRLEELEKLGGSSGN